MSNGTDEGFGWGTVIIIIILVIIIAIIIVVVFRHENIAGYHCNTNADCAAGHYCGGGNQCVVGTVGLSAGQPCTRNAQCQVGLVCRTDPSPAAMGRMICTPGVL